MSMRRVTRIVAAVVVAATVSNAVSATPEIALPNANSQQDSVFVTDGAMKNQIITFEWKENTAVYEGDILLNLPSRDSVQQNGVVTSIEGQRWPDARISYTIEGADRATVLAAVDHWEATTEFRFVERQPGFTGDHAAFVGGAGCASFVGRQGGRQEVTIGAGCSIGSTIHEIGHLVGFWHEHSRNDRGQFIRILEDNIQPGREHNFDQANNSEDIGAYDFGSIMHYPLNAFSRNGQNTIESIVSVPAGIVVGQRVGLSEIDRETARVLSGGGGSEPTLITKVNYDQPEDPTCTVDSIGGGRGYEMFRVACSGGSATVQKHFTTIGGWGCTSVNSVTNGYTVTGSCNYYRLYRQ